MMTPPHSFSIISSLSWPLRLCTTTHCLSLSCTPSKVGCTSHVNIWTRSVKLNVYIGCTICQTCHPSVFQELGLYWIQEISQHEISMPCCAEWPSCPPQWALPCATE